MTSTASTTEFHVGDSVKAATACDRMPTGTVVAYAHPIYQGVISAVRVENALGDQWWSETGSDRQWTSEEIKRRTGWAPFVVLHLPGESLPLNTEVRTGYRTYGPAPTDGENTMSDETTTTSQPTGHEQMIESVLTQHLWNASDEALCSCGWSPDDYFEPDADRRYMRDALSNAEEGDEPDVWAPVIGAFVAHQREHLTAALSTAGLLAAEREWSGLPDVELVAAEVHEAWMDAKRAQGVASRPSEWGEEQMVPYDDLSERAKSLDRSTVEAVYRAIDQAAEAAR